MSTDSPLPQPWWKAGCWHAGQGCAVRLWNSLLQVVSAGRWYQSDVRDLIRVSPFCCLWFCCGSTCKVLTHWSWEMHICVSELVQIMICLSSVWCQVITWTNAELLSLWTLRNKLQSNFNWNSNILFQQNEFWNVDYNMTDILSQPYCRNLCPSKV